MSTLVDIVDYVNLGLFVLAGVVAVHQWRRGGGRAGLWAALTFGALALVVVAGRTLPDDPETRTQLIEQRVIVAVLVLFPYLLYRFTTAFEAPSRRLERLVGVPTLVLVVWTFALPDFPEAGEGRPASFVAYLVAFLAHWTVLSIVVAYRLWRAGRRQPSVARKRMRLLAGAAIAMTGALFLAAFGEGEASTAALVAGLIATASAVAFVLGLAPPAAIRILWRRPEERRLQAAVADLMLAASEDEVAARVLPATARIVGARSIALFARDGRLIGVHGLDEATEARLQEDGATAVPGAQVVRSDGATFVVFTTPYAPFFGTDELALIRTLGALTELALDRARLFSHERETREALERADAVKSRFVAFAAHELRTPVASVVGLIETLEQREGELRADQVAELKRLLAIQARRMRLLVEQLLDLSRLDAEAVAIEPQPLRVRDRAAELVSAVAGEQADRVSVTVDPELEAWVDPAAFDRIVSNLIANALRYGEPPIRISAEQHDRHFRLAVEDHGPGVPAQFVPQLFERFARGSAAGSPEGSGLGLAIARSYAQAHRGELLYESAHPHGGARFQLVLPRDLRS